MVYYGVVVSSVPIDLTSPTCTSFCYDLTVYQTRIMHASLKVTKSRNVMSVAITSFYWYVEFYALLVAFFKNLPFDV